MENLDAPTLRKQNTVAGGDTSICSGLQLPCTFAGYELVEEVARGGMGVVFRARQLDLNRIVAVKMIIDGHFANGDDVRRFRAEAEAAANLDHPGIVPIYDVGIHNGRHFFSMAFIDGETLNDRLIQGPVDAIDAANFLAPVADAIEYAHQSGVVHRDLKPSNILIDKHNRPRVSDFGVAKTASDCGLTMQGELVGTPSYMPPEQAQCKLDEINAISDVYSLGAILYAMLTGRPPFQSANQLDTLHQVVHENALAPRKLNSKIPSDMETITLKCLEKQPARRYATAAELASDLRRFAAGAPIHAKPPGVVRRTGAWFRDNILLAGMSGLTTIVLVAGMLGLAYRCRMEMDNSAVLADEIHSMKEKANEHALRADISDMQRKQLDAHWRYADSERLTLLAEKTAGQDRRLAILLAIEGCKRLHDGGLPWEDRPAIVFLQNLIGTNSNEFVELVTVASERAGRKLTEEEKSQYLLHIERE